MAKQFNTYPIPTVLYKYRSWSEEYHRRILTDRELYLAQPSSFNDPFDSRTPVRWDKYSLDDCYRENKKLVDVFHKDKSRQERRKIARQITKSKKLWHPSRIKYNGDSEFEKWNDIIGLLSLSEDPKSILMWSHYAENHTGFVVGLYVDWLMAGDQFDFLDHVEYATNYPNISGKDTIEEKFRKKFFIKSDLWAYEKEWRATKNHIDNRVMVFPANAVKSVILGCEMREADQERIEEIAGRNFPEAVLLMAMKSKEKFALELSEFRAT